MSAKKKDLDLDALMMEQLESIDCAYLSFQEAAKWARTVIRYIKKPERTRVEIETSLLKLDNLLIKAMKPIITRGIDGDRDITEKDRSTYFDLLISIKEVKDKYDKKQDIKKKQTNINKRLLELEAKLSGD